MSARQGGRIAALLAVVAAGGWWAAPAARGAASGSPALEYHPGTTRKILQLIGDTDWPLRRSTITQTYSKAHVYGTDLGEPFEHQGRLWLAFGDSDGGNGGDCLGVTSATKPSELTDFDFPKDASNVYIPIKIGSYQTGSFDTPSGGISLNGAIYITYATESDSYPRRENNRRGILGKSTDGGTTWMYLYDTDYAPGNPPDVAHHHFIRIHMEKVAAADYPGLPWTTGSVVLIYGMSCDANVNPVPNLVYLACVPVDQIESGTSAWRYFTGLRQGTPTWEATQTNAVPLLDDAAHDSVGIFYFPLIGQWFGAYGTGAFHLADKPWGPFSPAGDCVKKGPDDLAANILHVAWNTGGYQDGFYYVSNGNPQPWNEDGFLYGMHVIQRFCRGTRDACELYYTLSTWNPYVACIMRSEIGLPQPVEPPVSQNLTITPGDGTWNKTSSTFFQSVTKFGKSAISTSTTAQGAASTGMMWRWLPRDYWNQELSFTVSAGCQDAYGAEVILLEGGPDLPNSGNLSTIYTDIKKGVYGNVVRDNWGVCGALVSTDTAVDCAWSLKPFDRSNLKVAIIDKLSSGKWGFIDVSQMTLDRNVPTTGTAISTVTPGDTNWTMSPGAWHTTVNHGGVDYFQTSAGDPATKGVAWRWLPRDWKNRQLDFQLLGGHATVLLVQGVDAIPVDGDIDALTAALNAGQYGDIRLSAPGPDSNDTPTSVSWDLTAHDSDKLKVVILDDLAGAWGWVAVSPMPLTRYETGNHPPFFKSNPIVKPGATIGVAISGGIGVDSSDPDAGDTITRFKLDGPDWLTIGTAGKFSGAPSVTDMGLNQWRVRVKDAENAYADALLQITVADRAPVFISDSIVLPNGTQGVPYSQSLAGQATDPDPGDTVTYSKAGGRDWLQVASDGALSGTPGPYDVGANSFIIRVTDSGGLTDDATVSFTVINVNDPPNDIALSNSSVDENSPNGTLVGTLSDTDPDSSDTAAYSFVAPNNDAGGRFKIANGAQLQTTGGPLLDYETSPTRLITVRVADSGGLTHDKDFVITVNNVNEAPAFTSDSIVLPNARQGVLYSQTISGQASDPDAGDTLTYSKISGRDWLHVASDGSLSGRPGYGDVGPNTFTIRATDGGGLSAEAILSIGVAVNANLPSYWRVR